MMIPQKPFPNYKWRWAEVTPSEGLNNPLRLLGVLRSLYRHQGEPKSTLAIHGELEQIQEETNYLTNERVTLARTGERNLLRNSERYWKALGLLDSQQRSTIHLSTFGQKVAEGRITQHEFSATVIEMLRLPNRLIEPISTITEWEQAHLEIRPLRLILDILESLFRTFGIDQAYITPQELEKIVIPIAGNQGSIAEYLDTLQKYRKRLIDVSLFPDCAPAANDKRMIREFLLFLAHYGYCVIEESTSNQTTKFILRDASRQLGQTKQSILLANLLPENLLPEPEPQAPFQEKQRQKKLREIATRTGQSKFRAEVLAKFNYMCFLTGENIPLVLEACHIVNVQHKGSDSSSNGLCLRADIHTLFDNRHIRIRPDGIVEYSDTVQQSVSYRDMPQKVIIPSFISADALRWRYSYY